MIDTSIIITGCVGLVTTIVSGWVSYFYTRRKYNSEVDSTVIHNMKSSLEFYEQLSTDTNNRLAEVLEKNKALEAEVAELRKQLFDLMSSICTDLTCQLRQHNTKQEKQNAVESKKKVAKK